MEFVSPTAKAVAIVGTFKGWRHNDAPMTHVGNGRWFKKLLLLPGIYEYQFLVDGQWIPDPQAGKTAPNQFGEVYSVLKVPERPNSGAQF